MTPEKLTPDDLAAQVRGTAATIRLLGQIFPTRTPDDLLSLLGEIESSPVAQELLHQVVLLRKLKVG